MKNLFLLALPLLLSCSLAAQTRDRTPGFGFYTYPTALCALSDGRFLVAGTGTPAPGQLFVDTIFAVVYDATGQIDLRLRVGAPLAEVHQVIDAAPTPDGGFALTVSATLCDVVSDQILLYSFAPDGTLRWEKQASWEFAVGVIAPAPDGAIVAAENNRLVAYHYLSGATLWEVPVAAQINIYDLEFIPGTENFAAVGVPQMQIWTKTDAPGAPAYAMTFSENLPPYASTQKVLTRPEGNYTYDPVQNRFIRFDENGSTLLTPPSFKPRDFAQDATGFWWVGWDGDRTVLQHTDLLGQNLGAFVVDDPWLFGEYLAIQGNTASIAGKNGSGPDSQLGSEYGPVYRASHLWLRTFPLDDPDATAQTADAGLLAVEQMSPVHVHTIPTGDPTFPNLYNLSGGSFRVQVTNNGDTPLQQADVLISFVSDVFFSICPSTPAVRRHYDNLDLAPGESAWLDFGDITAEGQSAVPAQYCFWTASPDELPDADHDSDAFCHAITLNTPASPEALLASLSPNPAGSAGFRAELPEIPSAALPYQLLNAAGQTVASGVFAPGTSSVWVGMPCQPAGLYFFRAGKWRGKVVLQP